MHLSGLFWYPIKSCRGLAQTEARLDARGIVGDRQYMLVDPDGGFLTQREYPVLALIEPRVEPDALTVSGPGTTALTFAPILDGPGRPVIVWDDACQGIDQGDGPAEWFSRQLGTPCRLVRFADEHPRLVDREFAVTAHDQVAFSDGYPLLLATEASLADLNQRLPAPIPMNRFRPNLVVQGAEAFAEDHWRRVRVGTVDMSVVKPCTRCKITTIDQDHGVVGVEPLRTMATFRRILPNGVQFAQNLIHDGPGVLRIGDAVTVLS